MTAGTFLLACTAPIGSALADKYLEGIKTEWTENRSCVVAWLRRLLQYMGNSIVENAKTEGLQALHKMITAGNKY